MKDSKMKKLMIIVILAASAILVSGCHLFFMDTDSIIATQVAMAIDERLDERFDALEQSIIASLESKDEPSLVPASLPTSTPNPTPAQQDFTIYGGGYLIGTPGGCLNAAFVSETVPDNTVFTPGDGFIKTWTIKNTGYCAWNTNFHLVLLSGDAMGGDTFRALTAAVAPGESVTITANLTAPSNPGTYRGEWRIQSDRGVNFARFWVQIIVK